MKRRISYFVVAVGMLLLAGTPATAKVTSNVFEPFAQSVFVPCANYGAGEVIVISGQLHVLLKMTEDSAGGLHMSFHFQPMGASGIGLTTDDTYRAVGLTRRTTKIGADGLPFTATLVDNFYMIGTAGGVSFKTHTTAHVTVNANGEFTAFVDNTSVTCM